MSRPSKSPNFTAIEKSVLLELIESRKDVIENKQNDGKMIIKKNSEWEKLRMNLTLAIVLTKENVNS